MRIGCMMSQLGCDVQSVGIIVFGNEILLKLKLFGEATLTSSGGSAVMHAFKEYFF